MTFLGPGRVYVYDGQSSWTAPPRVLAPGTTAPVGFGASLSSGYDKLGPSGPDLKDDLAVGAPGFGGAGAVFWYPNDVDAASILSGENPGDHFGHSVLLARDVTGDALPDLVVGAPENDLPPGVNHGAAYIFEGPGPFTCKLEGTAVEGNFGWALSEAGDVDRNRFIDLLIGQPENPAVSGPGTAFVRPVLR